MSVKHASVKGRLGRSWSTAVSADGTWRARFCDNSKASAIDVLRGPDTAVPPPPRELRRYGYKELQLETDLLENLLLAIQRKLSLIAANYRILVARVPGDLDCAVHTQVLRSRQKVVSKCMHAAQRAARRLVTLVAEFTEVETGKGSDFCIG